MLHLALDTGDPDLIAAAFTALAEGPGSPEFERLLEWPARLFCDQQGRLAGFNARNNLSGQIYRLALLSVLDIRREIWRILPSSYSLERSFQAFISDVRFPNFFTLFLR